MGIYLTDEFHYEFEFLKIDFSLLSNLLSDLMKKQSSINSIFRQFQYSTSSPSPRLWLVVTSTDLSDAEGL